MVPLLLEAQNGVGKSLADGCENLSGPKIVVTAVLYVFNYLNYVLKQVRLIS